MAGVGVSDMVIDVAVFDSTIADSACGEDSGVGYSDVFGPCVGAGPATCEISGIGTVGIGTAGCTGDCFLTTTGSVP